MRTLRGAASVVVLLAAAAHAAGSPLPPRLGHRWPQPVHTNGVHTDGGDVQTIGNRPHKHHHQHPPAPRGGADAGHPVPAAPLDAHHPDTVHPDADHPDDVHPDQAHPDDAHPDVHPDVHPDLAHPDQSHPSQPGQAGTPDQNHPAPGEPPKPTMTVFDRLEVQGILGKEVRSGGDENMGRIIDVIVDRSGQVRAAIIDVGGFLGVGSRKVAVAWNALRFPPDSNDPRKVDRIGLDLSREQVQAAPEYKEDKPVVVLGASGGLESLPFP